MERKNDLNEKIFDEALAYATKEECLRELEEIDQLMENEDYQFSDSFEKGMEALLKKERRRERHKVHFKIGRKMAACLAVILLVGIASVLSVDAWRVRLYNLVVKFNDNSSTAEFSLAEQDKNHISPEICSPGYVPDGFEVTETHYGNNINTVIFSNGTDRIIYQQFHFPGPQFTETTTKDHVKKTQVNGLTAYVITHNGLNRIIWNVNDIGFRISSSIDVKEIMKMAESVYKN